MEKICRHCLLAKTYRYPQGHSEDRLKTVCRANPPDAGKGFPVMFDSVTHGKEDEKNKWCARGKWRGEDGRVYGWLDEPPNLNPKVDVGEAPAIYVEKC